MDRTKHFPEKSILRKPLPSNQEQSSTSISPRKLTPRPCFEGCIKTTFIVDDSDPSLAPKEVFEPLQIDEEDDEEEEDAEEGETRPSTKKGTGDEATESKETSDNRKGRLKNWLRQSISVDGERVPGKLLHQCSLDHGYTWRNSSVDEESAEEAADKPEEEAVDLHDLQSQRALVEAELRRQAKAPPGLKIRDLLACRSLIEDEEEEEEDDEDEEKKEEEKDQVDDQNRNQGKGGIPANDIASLSDKTAQLKPL